MKLRLVSIETKPLITHVYDEHKNIKSIKGVFGSFLAEISSRFNISYTLNQPLDNEVGVYENGSWTGMFAMLANDKADLILGPSSVTNARKDIVNFSEELFATDIAILSATSNELQFNSILAHIENIDLITWILVVLSTIIVLIFIVFTQNISSFNAFWLLLSAFLNEPLAVKLRPNRSNLILMVYFYCMIFFWFSFNKVINAYLVTIKSDSGIDSLEELVKRSYVIPSIRSGSALENLFQDEKSMDIKEIWRRIKMNNNQGLVDRNKINNKSFTRSLADKKLALISSDLRLKISMIEFCAIIPSITVHISRPIFHTSNAIAFNKNLDNTIINKINSIIYRLKETAIFEKWFTEELFKTVCSIKTKRVKQCLFRLLSKRSKSTDTAYTTGVLSDTLPLFYLYVYSILASGAVLAAELLVKIFRMIETNQKLKKLLNFVRKG